MPGVLACLPNKCGCAEIGRGLSYITVTKRQEEACFKNTKSFSMTIWLGTEGIKGIYPPTKIHFNVNM